MTERPIIFSAPMVHAIVAGTKTQTRRIVKYYGISNVRRVSGPCSKLGDFDFIFPHEDDPTEDGNGHIVACPYGKPGDRLWVRETWMEPPYDTERFRYRATNPSYTGKWRPSIFMPRLASRITLEIVSVRCERLQDISGEDAVSEGIEKNHNGYFWGGPHQSFGRKQHADPRLSYRDLWDQINAKRAPWESNPWVWVIEFQWKPSCVSAVRI